MSRSLHLSVAFLALLCVVFATPAFAACEPEFTDLLAPGTSNDYWGSGIAVSGSTLVVGEEFADAAYVYEWDGAGWVESQVLTGGLSGSEFGTAVDVDGDWILVGAPRDGGQGHGKEAGAVHFFHFDMFRYDGSEWVEEQKLTAYDARKQDHYGRNVAVSPDTNEVLVASSNAAGIRLGAVYVYTHATGSWVYTQKIVPWGGGGAQAFGDAMAIEGNALVIGAQGADNLGSDSGAAFVYRYDGAAWMREQRLLASDGGESDRFGWSVAIRGDLIAVGAHNDADEAFNAGSAYVFEHSGTKWRQAAKVHSTGGEENGYFGSAVALADTTLVVGQEGNDAAQVFDITSCQP
jgi:hypothetical protein